MEKFINREGELKLIDDAVDALVDPRRLLRTPIIEFYGVDGIGKTTLLKKVQERCSNKQLSCVWEDLGLNSSYQFVRTTKKLLKEKGQAVVILDSLDAAYEEQLTEIEEGLSDLLENSNLFVVLASRRVEKFDNIRSIAKKLTAFPLKPFDRKSCEEYFDCVKSDIKPEIRNVIYEWTRGYPLAMDVMVEAILNQNLDPSKDRKQLISILTRKVIDRGVLFKVDDIPWYQTHLLLLSVPRRFNLIIMQDIIERFAPPDYQLPSALAYITLPDKINKATNVLSWSVRQGGYCIDTPIRNIFLLKLKIERPAQYVSMHRFLAELNGRFANEVSGFDRVRYLREYFYHLANSGEDSNLPLIITERIEQLIQEEPFDSFLQLYEEFLRDEELKEALGDNTNIVLSLLHRHLAETYRELAEEASELDRLDHLEKFFFHTVHDPEVKDFAPIFEEEMQRIRQKVSSEVYKKLIDDLSQDERFKNLFEKNS